jgi:hypothetical protein
MAKENKKSSSFFKKFFLFRSGAGGLHCQSRIGKKESFIFPAFSLVRTSRKETLKEFEIDIKMAPRVGFEPTTLRLTAGCSTVELSRSAFCNQKYIKKFFSCQEIFSFFFAKLHLFLKAF